MICQNLRCHLFKASILAVMALIMGLIITAIRSNGILSTQGTSTLSHLNLSNEDITFTELQKEYLNPSVLIIDARPRIFYDVGHIPGALSLPRDDFDRQYSLTKTTFFGRASNAVIVYCSDAECGDSQIVASNLRTLGFQHVRRFTDGWREWKREGAPVVASQ